MKESMTPLKVAIQMENILKSLHKANRNETGKKSRKRILVNKAARLNKNILKRNEEIKGLQKKLVSLQRAKMGKLLKFKRNKLKRLETFAQFQDNQKARVHHFLAKRAFFLNEMEQKNKQMVKLRAIIYAAEDFRVMQDPDKQQKAVKKLT